MKLLNQYSCLNRRPALGLLENSRLREPVKQSQSVLQTTVSTFLQDLHREVEPQHGWSHWTAVFYLSIGYSPFLCQEWLKLLLRTSSLLSTSAGYVGADLPTHGHVTQLWPISMAGSPDQWLVQDKREILVHLRTVNPGDFAETIGERTVVSLGLLR